MLFLEEQLVQHRKVHLNMDYSCNICDYICDNKRKFDYHIKAHASHKKFVCKIVIFDPFPNIYDRPLNISSDL